MTDKEADHYRESLVRVLDDNGVRWIADQAGEAIALGKTISKRVDPTSLMFHGELRGRVRSGSAQFRSTQDFVPIEKLKILLDANPTSPGLSGRDADADTGRSRFR